MKKQIIIFNGSHGSGKTTMAQNTSRILNANFLSEIGGGLRKTSKFNTCDKQYDFDFEVMKKELRRDQVILKSNNLSVVETWYFGNLAYMQIRTPKLYAEYKQAIFHQLNLFEPLVFLMDITKSTFMERNTLKGDSESLFSFYSLMNSNIQKLYHDFNVDFIKISNNDSLRKNILKSIAK